MRNKGTQGFTLVELMVVIAIIAAIVALVLPTLGASRDRAKAVECSINLGEIYRSINLYYEGAAGSMKIRRILDSYRDAPPGAFGAVKVTGVTDFGRDDIRDADGDRIPPQDFFFLELGNGYSVAVRGSGTEPKIKFYLFGRADVAGADDLAGVRQSVAAELAALAESVEADARSRAED